MTKAKAIQINIDRAMLRTFLFVFPDNCTLSDFAIYIIFPVNFIWTQVYRQASLACSFYEVFKN